MFRHTMLASAALLLAGCASIFNGPSQAITFSSEPTGANLTIVNRAGVPVHNGTTPATVTLKRGAGYFKPEVYTIRLTKPGYAPREIVVSGSLSGWYIGNVLFGGLIGMLAVDPVTGAMYTFPETVATPLDAASAPITSAAPTLTVFSLDAVPAELRKQARPLVAAAVASGS